MQLRISKKRSIFNYKNYNAKNQTRALEKNHLASPFPTKK